LLLIIYTTGTFCDFGFAKMLSLWREHKQNFPPQQLAKLAIVIYYTIFSLEKANIFHTEIHCFSKGYSPDSNKK
jgi:hypothetical protein